MSLSKRQTKELLSAFAAAVLATALAIAGVHYLSFLKNLDNISKDIRTAAFQPSLPQAKDVVIVAINEGTLAQFVYRSPVDREFLANLLKTLEKKGPKVIGLDILFDQATEPDKDDLLKESLRSVKTPLVVSYSNLSNVVTEDQLEYLNAFVPEQQRAAANLAKDPLDGSVRWMYPGESDDDEPKGFVRKVAEVLGIDTPKRLVEIAWRATPDSETGSFAVYPAHALAVLPDAWFKDKVVLIGAVLSITDRHETPLAVIDGDGDRGSMPGVMIHAHSLSQILDLRPEPGFQVLGSNLLVLLAAVLGIAIGLLKKGIVFNVVASLVLVVCGWVGALLGHRFGVPLVPLVAPTLALGLSVWFMDMLIGKAERKQKQFVQGAFSRYVSPEVVKQLMDRPEALSISGAKREVSFIFTDIAGFTTMSEALSSEKLSEVLNEYLDGACQIILGFEGTVDKFIGDAIMTIFNAPLEQADHAARAVQCALALDVYAETFRKKQNDLGIPIGETRIGVHTGFATIGNFGSASRMDYTALGDTVNT
ncbi:MAG: adenylate/guanylate cyclase domain-containing protein, partial [Akkermansiaceae bacterium]|nr:adenylate/guanylate cyclase domain-containing protein [Akkermansiaceae bacterium]